MKPFAASPAPRTHDSLAGAAWGFAEGTLFFIVPDVLLTWTALSSSRRALRQAMAAVVGAIAAGLVMHLWAAAEPGSARRAVGAVPFVRDAMFATAAADLAQSPLLGLARGSFTGLPYKVYAVEAPVTTPLAPFLLATAAARLPRFLLVVAVAALVASALRRVSAITPHRLAIGHALAWALFYAYYWSVI